MDRIEPQVRRLGRVLVSLFHYGALFIIGAATLWATVLALAEMLAQGAVGIDDILLLFIYLELISMVGIYFITNRLPVRFLIYVGITALTRMLLGDIQAHHHQAEVSLLIITGGILVLALASLVIRFGATRFPSVGVDDDEPGEPSMR
ncbi:MAG: phosphate-starvation-inducible PsiE family protein [Pseudomonadota bacterium]